MRSRDLGARACAVETILVMETVNESVHCKILPEQELIMVHWLNMVCPSF